MSEEVKVESKHKLNKKFLLFAIIGIVLVTIVAIVNIVPNSVRAKEVKEQLSLGDKYLSELNYEQAEVTYLAVLKIDPKCEDAYIGLANYPVNNLTLIYIILMIVGNFVGSFMTRLITE